MTYSLDQLRRARERGPEPAGDALADIPLDAPHDTDDSCGFWDGERFVSWRERVLRRPVALDSNTTAPVESYPKTPGKRHK